MSHFILVHGFNDRSAGKDNVDQVAPYLEEMGHTTDTDSTDYGWKGLIGVRIFKHKAVLRILNAIMQALGEGHEVVLVAYSNGANYAVKALRLLFVGHVKLILVHPALRRNTIFPNSISCVWVCITRSDWAVKMARFVRWLIPEWGNLGAKGYKGDDKRVETIDYTDVAKGHGGLFKPEIVKHFAGELDRLASEPCAESSSRS